MVHGLHAGVQPMRARSQVIDGVGRVCGNAVAVSCFGIGDGGGQQCWPGLHHGQINHVARACG